MAPNNLLVFILYNVLFVQSVLGMQCYVCNSGVDSECEMSPTPSKYLQECSHENREQVEGAEQLPNPQQNGIDGEAQQNSMAPVPSKSQPEKDEPAAAATDDDKDLPFNRTSRNAEDAVNMKNDTTEPGPFQTNVELPKEATFCRKISYHIPKQNNGPNNTREASIRVIRSCGWILEPSKNGDKSVQSGCKWIGSEGVQMNQCVCTGDGCNSGKQLLSFTSQTLILLAVMTAGYFYIL